MLMAFNEEVSTVQIEKQKKVRPYFGLDVGAAAGAKEFHIFLFVIISSFFLYQLWGVAGSLGSPTTVKLSDSCCARETPCLPITLTSLIPIIIALFFPFFLF